MQPGQRAALFPNPQRADAEALALRDAALQGPDLAAGAGDPGGLFRVRGEVLGGQLHVQHIWAGAVARGLLLGRGDCAQLDVQESAAHQLRDVLLVGLGGVLEKVNGPRAPDVGAVDPVEDDEHQGAADSAERAVDLRLGLQLEVEVAEKSLERLRQFRVARLAVRNELQEVLWLGNGRRGA